ncbi:LuxR C-terminal-related transcriptional regulator [Nocardia brasiliensis]|uniref:Putative LuxR family transcriptional regulator n=1 Tax=Nocardia brasiliensis (strain ATCC 700358 / HUJEG-1) TaxID=1133849 RepID=K0EHQ8_NOCB7|nr:LuxR C-terminal-related transcriptional regulator [Nocardia brasiliensis]AFT98777.1 putative LuxR family transcriptional regulator [Nocardia brasiliensis ATCC 700358]ASF13221.1 DNA-binding response regulator [Nocardia brasiliensis]OCF89115.1 LuxR family transcriptional regulator [Nocardia brasiliensis]SUB11392.1 Bacterial regulatory proteins, luxR family [Nocardia brasiliensis]
MSDLGDIFEPGSPHGRTYAVLVHHPRSNLADIAQYLGVSEDSAAASLDVLCELRAAVRVPAADGEPVVWDAHAPESLSEAEARRRQQQINQMHTAAARLSETFRSVRRSPRSNGAVVPVFERLEMLADFEEMQTSARTCVKVVERGPYLSDLDRERQLFQLKRSRLGEGIRYQTLYQDTIYQDPERLRHALSTNASGAQARTLPEPPFKLIISDDERASLVLHVDERRPDPMGLRITGSPALDLLIKTFDVLWSLAAPISVNPTAEALDERDRAILTLMGLGATDDTIARRLGMSRRTVVRRTARLLERLGASTRFQAGVQATRRGWL